MTNEQINREQLLNRALLLGELAGFRHRPEMQSRRLLELLEDRELQTLVAEAVEEFRAAFR